MARMEGPVATSMGIVYSCDWEIETWQAHSAAAAGRQYHAVQEASGHTIHTIASGPGFPGRSDSSGSHSPPLYAAKEHLIMTTPTSYPATTCCIAICTALPSVWT